MHTPNHPTRLLSLSCLFAITLLAGCQPKSPSSLASSANSRDKRTEHTQYIPIFKDGLDSLKVSDSIMIKVERDSSKPNYDAGYWLGLGTNKGHASAHKFATATFDIEDLGNTYDKVAGVRVDQGWAMSIRKYRFPPPRTTRISSGTPRDYMEATRLAVIDGVLSTAPKPDQSRSSNQPPVIAEDPESPEILVYCHIPDKGTYIAEDWVLYRKVQGATEEVTYFGYTEDGKMKGSVTLKPGTWAIFNRAASTWTHMGEIPAQSNPPAIVGFGTLLEEVKKATGRSFYKQAGGGTNPSDPSSPSNSTSK